ncbi:MAG: acetyl-CoA carboxylase, biotin carboxyl carrier protein [Bacteroidetes bacterium MED-G21]|nr:MAG: acetyl-CoA carboxylase, biotin carboxyl carrier protein [Bacteroidetes bacterium MED-G21]|tara:strand:- start:128 stop:643 length:516 start_codon:yes stop_codon:yes gene_type:complete
MALDIKEIQELIKFVAKSGVSEVDLEMGDMKISIKTPPKKGKGQVETVVQQIPVTAAPSIAPIAVQSAPVVAAVPEVEAETPVASSDSDDSKYVTIKSPMIGTFYRKPSPDKDPFINVGDEVNIGTVVCVVEAMKLFNEIESEISGKIIKVLVEDMSPIEYDQPLFLVDPS